MYCPFSQDFLGWILLEMFSLCPSTKATDCFSGFSPLHTLFYKGLAGLHHLLRRTSEKSECGLLHALVPCFTWSHQGPGLASCLVLSNQQAGGRLIVSLDNQGLHHVLHGRRLTFYGRRRGACGNRAYLCLSLSCQVKTIARLNFRC